MKRLTQHVSKKNTDTRNPRTRTAPSPQSVNCDHIECNAQYCYPSLEMGPVEVAVTNGQITWCELMRDVVPSEVVQSNSATAPTRWQWDYLRGVWPTHRARRLVAGSAVLVGGAKTKASSTVRPSIVIQVQTNADNTLTERCYYLDGPTNTTVEVWISDANSNSVKLTPGTYTEIQPDPQGNPQADTLSGASAPHASDPDPCSPANFVKYVNQTAGYKNLTSF
jgi:hypothetical protein